MEAGDSQASLPGTWRFGAVEVDERLAVLRVAGAVVDVDRSSYDVLLALLRHAGEVVTKDELLECGWPGRVVSENSLAKSVSRLRTALGEDAGALRAVHGYGYRLAAIVQFRAAQESNDETLVVDATELRAGAAVPHRIGWRLERRLGAGAAGVSFLARSNEGEQRTFKFANGEAGLRGLKREVALARYIQAVKPDLHGVAHAIEWNLAQPPFYLERTYFADGHCTDWATARGGLDALPLAERLALCADLCDTVAGLHEIGVIHKDLKPENLFPVQGEDGRWHLVLADLGAGEAAQSPRLVELGITMSLAATVTSQQAGSLLYIAPEVIAGEMPTQRSDVFALGVLLYQFVVGNLRRSLAPGWEADVADALLREDIALAAAANPERRLVDARTLGERLRTLDARRAHAAHERELEAAQLVQSERAARERTHMRVGLVALGALAIGLAGTVAMWAVADNARRDAEAQATQRQAVLDFVTDGILGQADPYAQAGGGTSLTLREAMQRATESVDARLQHDPAAAAAVHAMVGAAEFAQDRHDAAIAQYKRARTLYLRVADTHVRELVQVETGLCDVLRIANHLTDAEAACASALQRAKSNHVLEDFATLKFGQLRTEQGRYPEAQTFMKPLLARNAFAKDAKSNGELRWSLGLCARNLGHYREAQAHFEALLALYRQSDVPSTWLGWAYNSLGSVLEETGQFDAAEKTLLEARRIFASTQGAGQVEAQMPNIWRAEIRLQRGQWQEAAAMQSDLLQAWSALAPGHPLRRKAEATRAWALAEAGDRDQARTMLDAAWADRNARFVTSGDRIAARALRWARAAVLVDQPERARWMLSVADAEIARMVPTEHPQRAEAFCTHARLSLATGDAQAATRSADACIAMLAKFHPATHPQMREAQQLRAQALRPVRRESARTRVSRCSPSTAACASSGV